MLKRYLVIAVMVLGIFGTASRPGHAQELGMTPSHVLGLWTNINNALIASAQVVSDDAVWVDRIEAMAPVPQSGKTPADVLQQVVKFRAMLDKLRQGSGLPRTIVYGEGEGVITPSVVFLNSGHALNGLVDWLVRNTGPEQLVSQFYERNAFSGKTPSDVITLVVLADQRLDAILAKSAS